METYCNFCGGEAVGIINDRERGLIFVCDKCLGTVPMQPFLIPHTTPEEKKS